VWHDRREYIEAALLREAFDASRRLETPAEVDELVRRATVALATPGQGISRDESIARAHAAVAAVRALK
jgi:hypothetical protein